MTDPFANLRNPSEESLYDLAAADVLTGFGVPRKVAEQSLVLVRTSMQRFFDEFEVLDDCVGDNKLRGLAKALLVGSIHSWASRIIPEADKVIELICFSYNTELPEKGPSDAE